MAKTILAVDDSKTIRKAVELTFRATEFSVVTAQDESGALAQMEATPPDLVFVDAGLPEDAGYRLAATIRTHRPNLPVILLTSSFFELDTAKAEQAGVRNHVNKPFETQALIEMAKTQLGEVVETAEPRSFAARLAERQSASTDVPQAEPIEAPVLDPEPVVETVDAGFAASPMPAFKAPAPVASFDEASLSEEEDEAPPRLPMGPSLEPPPPPPEAALPSADVDVWALSDDAEEIEEIEDIDIEDVPDEPAMMPVDDEGAEVFGFEGGGFDSEPEPPPGFGLSSDVEPVDPAGATETMAEVAVEVAVEQEPVLAQLPPDELRALAREVVEKIAWEVVPELAETIIKEELRRLVAD